MIIILGYITKYKNDLTNIIKSVKRIFILNLWITVNPLKLHGKL